MPAIHQLHLWVCKAVLTSSLLIYVMMLSRLVSALPVCKFISNTNFRSVARASYLSAFNGHYSELAIYSGSEKDIIESLSMLSSTRPQLKIIEAAVAPNSSPNTDKRKENEIVWSAHCENLQVDCTFLEPLYLGNNKESSELTAKKWNEILDQRSNILSTSSKGDYKSKMGCLSHITAMIDSTSAL